jgi:hypothetical protein
LSSPKSIIENIKTYPWIATEHIVSALSEHSVMPSAELLYDSIQSDQLKLGNGRHLGLLVQKFANAASENGDIKGIQWFEVDDDPRTGHMWVKFYYDVDSVWKIADDIHHSSIRIPVTERVDFYRDHWEQTNKKGKFTGVVDSLEAKS